MDASTSDGIPQELATAETDRQPVRERSGLGRALTLFKTRLRRHLFTVVAVAGVVALLWRVSQVRNLIVQFPEDTLQWWGFLATLVVVAGSAGISIAGFVWPAIMDAKNPLLFYTVGWFALITLNWLNALAARMSSLGNSAMGLVIPLFLAVLGAAWLLFLSSESVYWQPWPLASGFARMLAVSIFWIGIWLLFGKYLGPDLMTASEEKARDSQELDDTNRRHRVAWQVSGRVLAYLTLTILLGECLWVAAVLGFPLASLRLYSVWAIFEIASIAILVCALIDYLDHKTLWPWRLTSMFVVLGVIWMTGPQRVNDKLTASPLDQTAMPAVSEVALESEPADMPIAASDSSDDSSMDPMQMDPWYADLETRVDNMPDGPVVLVAASGGGSRAALFAAMVLDMLHSEPMTIPLLDVKSRPPVPGSDAEDGSVAGRSKGNWGDHILAISCVSGGTLASARYVQLSHSPLPQYDNPQELRYTDFRELVKRADGVIDELIADSSQDPDNASELEALEAARAQLKAIDARYHPGEETRQSSEGLAAGIPATDDGSETGDLVESVFRSKFIDEMCIDYMASILRGVLVPLEPRGQSLYQFWNQQFDWGGLSRRTWRRHWDPKTQPMLLVNGTDIDNGRRMVIGYPSLPPGLLPAAGVLDRIPYKDFESSVRAAEYSPYSMSSVDPETRFDITLGRAVRISSSFPFGFRPTSIAVPDPTPDDPKREKVLNYLDGGIVDNTGIDTLHALIVALAREADSGSNYVATRLMGKLRKRGVILVEIDSGAKPSRRSPSGDPFRIITQPIGALGSASYTTALRTSDGYLSEIERLLSDDHAAFLAREMLRDAAPIQMSRMAMTIIPSNQLELISGSLRVLQEVPKEPTCKVDRLTCNSTNLDEQVMTAFALGPQGKARVIAQFLVQRNHWRTTLRLMGESYQQSLEARQVFGDDPRSKELCFTRLVEASGKWVKQLETDLENPSPPSKAEVRERIKIPIALMTAAAQLATDEDLEREIQRNPDLQELIAMVTNGQTNELFAHFVSTEVLSPTGGPTGGPTVGGGPVTSMVPTTTYSSHRKESIWNNAVQQAQQISKNYQPVPSKIAIDPEQLKQDPFEFNKTQRLRSEREFYQAK